MWKSLLCLIIGTSCAGDKLAVHEANAERVSVANHKVSLAGTEFIKQFEGLRQKPYVCPGGTLTVGYGQVIASQKEFTEKYPNGFSGQDAEDLLRNKLATIYAKDIQRLVQVPLLQREFDMLVSLNYNIGATALCSPASKPQNDWQVINLLPLLNASRYEEASLEFPKFTKGGPETKYYRGLLKRRMAEMFVFRGSTSIPQELYVPIEDANFRKVTKCDSIAKYWGESGQRHLRDEAVLLYHKYSQN